MHLTLYQNWNRTPVYFKLAVSASYTKIYSNTCQDHQSNALPPLSRFQIVSLPSKELRTSTLAWPPPPPTLILHYGRCLKTTKSIILSSLSGSWIWSARLFENCGKPESLKPHISDPAVVGYEDHVVRLGDNHQHHHLPKKPRLACQEGDTFWSFPGYVKTP